jgi:thioesterase domain-containing protein/acyl carrier protein
MNLGRRPRDAVEMQLCDIWQTVLALDEVGIDDDLFDIGGDSLAGVRILSEVESIFGVDLELLDFFSAPSVSAIAKLIRQGQSQSRLGGLVRMQAGEGPATALYLFPPLPGTLLTYTALVRALGSRRPVWGVQSSGIEPGEPLLDTVEAMAERSVSRLLTVHDGGPWCLFGYSMGGYLAVEVARLLRTAGHEVGMVALLDTSAPDDIEERPAATVRANAVRTMARYVLHLDVDLDWLSELPPELQVEELLDRAIAAGTLPPDYNSERIRRLLDVRLSNRMALTRYRPLPYPGRVSLFRATEPSPDIHEVGESEDRLLGWGPMSRAVDLYEIPSSHLDIIDRPGVDAVAKQVNALLDGLEHP